MNEEDADRVRGDDDPVERVEANDGSIHEANSGGAVRPLAAARVLGGRGGRGKTPNLRTAR